MTLWITAKAINNYFRIVHTDLRILRMKLKGTPYLKKSSSRCSNVKGKWYYLYDLDYLKNVLGLSPKMEIPSGLLK